MEQDNVTKQFSKRLQEIAKSKGIISPQQLADATAEAGYRISYTSVYKNWKGDNSPGLLNLLAYAKTLNVNLHYLITGEEPPKADLSTIRKMVEEAASESAAKSKDARLSTINRKWGKLTEPQKKYILSTLEVLSP